MKRRLYSIDMFRIVSALFVFLFHSRIHLNVDYFVLNPFIGMSHIFMVAFFMLSGFALYYVDYQNNQKYEGVGNNCIGNFFKRRVIGIYPLYIATYVLFILVYVLGFSLLKNNEYINQYINENIGNYSILKNLLILPVELTMLQSVFDGSFSVLHNGGTWFISCLFICYLIYPYLFKIITQNKKVRVRIMILLYLISSYAFLVQWGFKFGSIYGNPFFRFLEFFIGMITASLCMDRINVDIKQSKLIFVFIVFFILIAVITIGGHWFGIYEVGAYNFIAIPVFGMILYLLARIEYKYPLKRFMKCISVLSENTYAFFLAQFFTWEPIKIIENNTNFFNYGRNIKLFLCSLVICCSVTIFLHYGIEKPMKKILSNKYLLGR